MSDIIQIMSDIVFAIFDIVFSGYERPYSTSLYFFLKYLPITGRLDSGKS